MNIQLGPYTPALIAHPVRYQCQYRQAMALAAFCPSKGQTNERHHYHQAQPH